MSIIIGFLAFLFVFGLMITVHELGHFAFAKLFNVYCDEFSFGMGPVLLQKKGKETKYSIRALPIGGYVAMAGEDGSDQDIFKDVPANRTIKGISLWKRLVIMFAGAGMNFVLAWVVFFGISVVNPIANFNSPIIGNVQEGAAADGVLLAGDEILGLKKEGVLINVASIDMLSRFINEAPGEVTLVIKRNSETIDVKVTPQLTSITETESKYLLGVSPSSYNDTFFGNFVFANKQFSKASSMVFNSLRQLVTNPVETSGELSGPIGIYQVIAKTSEEGITSLLVLMALLSVNIGIFNLLPIPILDGGRMLLEIYSGITRRPINKRVEAALFYFGIGFMLLLFVVASWNDISRIISGFMGG